MKTKLKMRLAIAFATCLWGAMAWGGQWCTSPGYAYVHESVADQFVDEARKALIEMYGEDPRVNSDYSRVINAAAVNRIAGLIDPSKVIIGGQSDPDAHYLAPTIVYPVTWDDKIMEDEINKILTDAQKAKLKDLGGAKPFARMDPPAGGGR